MDQPRTILLTEHASLEVVQSGPRSWRVNLWWRGRTAKLVTIGEFDDLARAERAAQALAVIFQDIRRDASAVVIPG